MAENIFDRLYTELASRGDFLARQPTMPSISVPVAELNSLVRSVKELKTVVDILLGNGGSVADKALNLRDMINGGALSLTLGGQVYAGDPSDDVVVTTPGSGDPRPYYDPPPVVTNLSAGAAFKNVVLEWDVEEYQNHAYVEIWRATVDALGSASKIGTSTANVFPDSSGATGITYYYWVRAVNIEGNFGPFNAVSGVPATLLGVDTADYVNLSIVNAAIANLAVDNAKIANLAVDNAKIANCSVDKLTAGSMRVSSYIESTSYFGGSSGFRIDANGTVEFNTGTFRGALGAATGTFAGSLTAATGTFAGSLTAATGTFTGSLTAVTGTLGSLSIASGGNIRQGQTAFNTGTGFWIGDVSGTPKLSIGNPAGSSMNWDGTDLNINSAKFDTFSASISGGNITASPNPATAFGSRTVTVSGGKSPYTYAWILSNGLPPTDASHVITAMMAINSGNGTATVDLIAYNADTTNTYLISGRLICIVTDSNGRNTTTSITVAATVQVRTGADGGGDGGG